MKTASKKASKPAPGARKPETVRELLLGGGPFFKGRTCEVAELVAKQPRRLASLIECLWDEDPGVASRAADALERITGGLQPGVDPRRLETWKESLLGLIPEAQPIRLRWNLALTISRLGLTVQEARRAAAALREYLDDRSSIVKTAAMHGLAGLTRHDPSLLPEVIDLLRILSRSGTPAMRARGRILLKRLESGGKKSPRGAQPLTA
jgi:HEAT repeat protein